MTRSDKIGALCIVLAFIAVSAALFIFGNSLKDGKESNQTSSKIAEHVKPVIDPQDKITYPDFHKIVRKTAHGLEYFMLGLCASALCFGIYIKKRGMYLHVPFLLSLTTAAADEFIQSKTGRTSSVSDVMIDLGGAVAGIVVFLLAALLVRRIYRRKTSARPKHEKGNN